VLPAKQLWSKALCAARQRLQAGSGQPTDHLHPRRNPVPHPRWCSWSSSGSGGETGGCPHTAIREDARCNRAAVEELEQQFSRSWILVLVESGATIWRPASAPKPGDSLHLCDRLAAGDKIPRKGGPWQLTHAPTLLVSTINDLPFHGGRQPGGECTRDTGAMRGGPTWCFHQTWRSGEGLSRSRPFCGAILAEIHLNHDQQCLEAGISGLERALSPC